MAKSLMSCLIQFMVYLRGKVSDGKVFVGCISSLSERSIVIIAGRTHTKYWISAYTDNYYYNYYNYYNNNYYYYYNNTQMDSHIVRPINHIKKLAKII